MKTSDLKKEFEINVYKKVEGLLKIGIKNGWAIQDKDDILLFMNKLKELK